MTLAQQMHLHARRTAWYYRIRYCRQRIITDRLSWSDVAWRLDHAVETVHVDAWTPADGWQWMFTRIA